MCTRIVRWLLPGLLCLLASDLCGQMRRDTVRVVTWNILNFPGSNYPARLPAFQKIMRCVQPDLLVVQEMLSQNGVDLFLNQVLNSKSDSKYQAAPFVNGPDTDNALFYNATKFTLLSNRQISTVPRDISVFTLQYQGFKNAPALKIYACHLKAGNTPTDLTQKHAAATILRHELNQGNAASYFFVCGDFNVYKSSEAAYQELIESQSDNDGRGFDPLDKIGSWTANASYQQLHTQSTRTQAVGGGASGGLDDRFDFVLISNQLRANAVYRYLEQSYTAYGNDGQHFNKDINAGSNAAVPDSIATALYEASDHLPVYLDFTIFPNQPPQITSTNQTMAVEDAFFFYQAQATDVEHDKMTFTFQDYPAWLTPRDSIITGTPSEGASDTTFTCIASDGQTADTLVVAVTVVPVNDPPQIVRLQDWSLVNAETYWIDLDTCVIDPDDPVTALQWQVTADDPRLRIHFEQHRVGFNAPGWSGKTRVTLTVTDRAGAADTLKVKVTGNAITNAAVTQSELPVTCFLAPNYPNPFTAWTRIDFGLAAPAYTRLRIYNLSGALVSELRHNQFAAGRYHLIWEAGNYPGGVYFIRLETEHFVRTIKCVHLK
ncbi:T9SS type A sorting domain-containing protein [candidate division KSB1 bacterium]|nr:T9SS type A sorting domain-containing protein [candidate division KSB1 bacterium]